MIAIDSITVRFDTSAAPSFTVFENLSLKIGRGEVVSLLGPSGCGKTTVLRCVAGLLEPQRGSITIDGESINQAQERKQIGISFQESVLVPWLTVKENICLPIKVGNYSSLDRFHYESILSLIQLEQFQDAYPSQLSGGMKQRVSLARSLITKPSLLLLDEPFNALDSFTKMGVLQDVYTLIKSLRTTVLFVTHSIEEAVYLSDSLYSMSAPPSSLQRLPVPTFDTREKLYISEHFSQVVTTLRSKLLAG